jgi:glycosyltransferase involved in cell wall biosynthesis
MRSIVSQVSQLSMVVKYVLGHDVHTGQRAINIAKYFNVPVAIFHHMDYRAYKPFQKRSEKEPLSKQEEILKDADVIFAIGSKLEKSALAKIRGAKKQALVVKIFPGLAEIEPIDESDQFSVITFGRVNAENRLLKQVDLAVASFGEALANPAKPLGKDAVIVILGLSSEKENEEYLILQKIAEQYAKRAVPIHAWPYEENREELFNELRKHSVCMMLSIHEGFGLVGLEALSAGVPLILSENTGIYEALTDSPDKGGLGIDYPYHVDITGSFDNKLPDEDIKAVTNYIYEIARDLPEAKRRTLAIRAILAEKWTWSKTALQVFSELKDRCSWCETTSHQAQAAQNSSGNQDKAFNDLTTKIFESLNTAKQIFSQELIIPDDCNDTHNHLGKVNENIQSLSSLLNSNISSSHVLVSILDSISVQQFFFYTEINRLNSIISEFRGICQDKASATVTQKKRIQRDLDSLTANISELLGRPSTIIPPSLPNLHEQEARTESSHGIFSQKTIGAKQDLDQSTPAIIVPQEIRDQLVIHLLACQSIDDKDSRETIIERLEGISIRRNPREKRIDVANIVNACLNYPNGLKNLVEAVRFFEQDSIPRRKLDAFLKNSFPDFKT